MIHVRRLPISILVAIGALSSGAAAQAPAPGGSGRETPIQTMALTTSVSAGSSRDVTEGSTDAPRPSTDVDATLAYHRRGRRFTFELNGISALRRVDAGIVPMRQEGAFDLAFSGSKNQFHLTQALTYSPSYRFGGSAGVEAVEQTALTHGDLANARLAALASTSAIDWGATLSRRVSLSALYNVRRTEFDDTALNMTSQEAGFGLTRRLTRHLAVRTAYTYRAADFASTPGAPIVVHDVNAGLDFSRPITLSKRTTVSFNSGSTLAPVEGGLAFRVTGAAALTRLLGRTWNARLGVRRGVRLVEGFTEPLMDNSVDARLAGNIRRNAVAFVSGLVSSGTVGLAGGPGSGYANWTVASGMSINAGRQLTFDLQYFVLGDRFGAAVTLPPGLAADRWRQGARVGFTWHAPLLRTN